MVEQGDVFVVVGARLDSDSLARARAAQEELLLARRRHDDGAAKLEAANQRCGFSDGE